MNPLNNLLKKYKDKKVLLIGSPKSYPEGEKLKDALYMDSSYISANTRQTNLHSTFDVVFICDPEIFNTLFWETILDEIIRFTKDKAVIVIHARSTLISSVWGIKSFISDKINLSTKLISQKIVSRIESFIEMEIEKKINQSKNWSIGIPSNGEKIESILNLLESIDVAKKYLLSREKIKIEIDIMITGKNDKRFDNYQIKFFEQSLHKNLAALGEKKYIMANNAIYENILLIHDRYVLDKSFFLGFERWGYDFEFCTTQQFDHNGNVYDPILNIESFDRGDKQMFRLDDQSYHYDKLYINGGLIIVKKSIVNYVNFNPNLLQSEAEDIDFARKLHAIGIIPRFNSQSVAITSTNVNASNLSDVPVYGLSYKPKE